MGVLAGIPMNTVTMSRERIAELREQALDLDDAQERAEALALLDAYEAQRPRPASEVPPLRKCVLIEYGYGENPLVSTGYYSGGPMPWHIDRSGRFPDEAVHRWWPLPKGGDDE